MKPHIKKIRGEVFGKDKVKDTFQNVLINDMSYEDGIKMRDFWNYCHVQFSCPDCSNIKRRNNMMKPFKYDSFKHVDSYSLILKCSNCLRIETLSDTKTCEMVKWFDDLMLQYGYSFTEGWPPLVELPDSIKLDEKKAEKARGTFV